MRSGTATKKASGLAATLHLEPQTSAASRSKTKPHEKENDPAANFIVGALLFSLLTSNKLDDLLLESEEGRHSRRK